MGGFASLLLIGIVLAATSGIPGLFAGRRSLIGQWITTALAVGGSGCGLWGTWSAIQAPPTTILRLPSPIAGAEFVLATDAISSFFLAPIFLISLLGAIYGLDYWKQDEHPDNGRKLRMFYGLLSACLAVLVLAHNSVTFLFGWEGMALSAFFLVATEDQNPEVRTAGWLYLAASHSATLCLFAMFALLYGLTGSFDLVPLTTESISPTAANIVFLLALAGFGLKAGVMPLHFWLPSAHAMAPSHVSALMSGVLIKSGIYGLVRITSLLPQIPLWWGVLLLSLGVVSSVLGVAFALGQHDLKRLLAYHSIENIGIIIIGLALAVLGRTLGHETWVVLGLSGCLLHVWNHSLFKSLLFFSAGSVIHARHTREIDALGGLARAMPWTAGTFLLGAVAICGLPPLNGFVSEFLIYIGLFRTLSIGDDPGLPAAAFAVPALAMTGALAVACFVKVFGVVFLGVNRSPELPGVHESPWSMIVPSCVLAAFCVTIGLAPTLLAPLLDRAVAAWTVRPLAASSALTEVAPLEKLSLASVVLWGMLVVGAALLTRRLRAFPLVRTETWGCGYTAPTARMQYTASSFAQMLVALFSWALRPTVHRPRLDSLFPATATYESHVPEVVLEGAVSPLFDFLARVFQWCRLVQQGNVQMYLLYILGTLVLLLLLL
jgi:hydrogenase-4 component B